MSHTEDDHRPSRASKNACRSEKYTDSKCDDDCTHSYSQPRSCSEQYSDHCADHETGFDRHGRSNCDRRPKKTRGTQSVVQFGSTQQPGIYILTGPNGRPLHFVAQTSREESDPRVLDDDQMQELAADLGAQRVASSAEYVELDKTRRHGREVWRLLLFGAMSLMFAELILQQRFTRVRS